MAPEKRARLSKSRRPRICAVGLELLDAILIGAVEAGPRWKAPQEKTDDDQDYGHDLGHRRSSAGTVLLRSGAEIPPAISQLNRR